MSDDVLNFVYVCDAKAEVNLIISLTSLFSTLKTNRKYRIHIVSNGLILSGLQYFLNAKVDNIDMIVIEPDESVCARVNAIYNDAVNKSANKTALLKFYIPELLPDVDKALYLDSDIIIKSNIDDLLDIDLTNGIAAVCEDFGICSNETDSACKMFSSLKGVFSAVPNSFYFNSGVMVLNLSRMREDQVTQKLETAKKNMLPRFQDQDAFNYVFWKNYPNGVMSLSPLDNFLLCSSYVRERIPTDKWLPRWSGLAQSLINGREPRVYHYAGSKPKLWYKETYHPDHYFNFLANYYIDQYKDYVYRRKIEEYEQAKSTILPKLLSYEPPTDGDDGSDLDFVISIATWRDRLLYGEDSILAALRSIIKSSNMNRYRYQVVLNIYEDDMQYVSDTLKKFCESNSISIYRCPVNLKPHNKYFWSLCRFTKCPVITADDDCEYYPDVIQQVVKTHERFPDCVVAGRTNYIKTDTRLKKFLQYKYWPKGYDGMINTPSHNLLATGGGMVMYPVGFDIKSIDALDGICRGLTVDDLTMKKLEYTRGIKVVRAGHAHKCPYKDTESSFADTALSIGNCVFNENDIFLKFLNFDRFESSNALIDSYKREFIFHDTLNLTSAPKSLPNSMTIESLVTESKKLQPKPKPSSPFSFSDDGKVKHDAVFVLGSGSSHADLELLLAIHSMRKFCPFIDRIFVVGDKPKCNLSRYEITHVPCEDIFDRNKDANIMHKVLHAIKSIPDLTDNFLLCSDDQLVAHECTWNDFKPKYVKEYNPDDMTFGPHSDKGWRSRLISTLSKAYERRGKAWFYEPHIWSPVNKKSFKAMIQSIKGLRNAGVVFSQYYNSIDNLDHEQLHDHMSFFSDSMDWSNEFKNPPLFISYSDVAFKNEEFRKQLALLLK